MNDQEFAAVVQLARASLIGRICHWASSSWKNAWPSSAAVQWLKGLGSAGSEWSTETRVRFGALTIAWAGLGYAICLALLPRYVMSALPLAWTASLIVGALIVASLSDQLVVAWNERFRGNS